MGYETVGYMMKALLLTLLVFGISAPAYSAACDWNSGGEDLVDGSGNASLSETTTGLGRVEACATANDTAIGTNTTDLGTAANHTTATELATGVDNITPSNLVDKSAAETITGLWTHSNTGTHDFGGPVTATSFTADNRTTEPGNLISLDANDTAFTNDPTCANSGVTNKFTIIDKDENAADDYVACDGTSEIFRFHKPYMFADSGGDAAETSLSVSNQFFLMNISLTELADTTGEFTTNANEICYTGVEPFGADLMASTSFDRTTGSGTDTITFVFGMDTTGAIGDGDEFGEQYPRTISNNAVIGALTVSTYKTFVTNDCIGLLGATNGATDGITMEAVSIHIDAK